MGLVGHGDRFFLFLEITRDLSGVMKLQRRLSMMERDLSAIQAKLDSLKSEADEIAVEKPQQAMAIREDIQRIQHVGGGWSDGTSPNSAT